MGRESDGVISLTFGDLERSDQGHLLKNEVYVRDSAHRSYTTLIKLTQLIDRGSDGVISLTLKQQLLRFDFTSKIVSILLS